MLFISAQTCGAAAPTRERMPIRIESFNVSFLGSAG
jgi:hypothetical protein